ncbi:MAG: hypothetical protein AB3K77_10870 [Methanosarcinaceae archaeon]
MEEEVKKIESINRCVDNLIEYFGLTGLADEQARNCYKWELPYLFFEYKRLQEEFNISITDFVTLLIKGIWSKSKYCKTNAQLVGFKSNLEKIKIGNFTIRMPTEGELNRIINDLEKRSMYPISNPSDIASVSFRDGSKFWVFAEIQEKQLNHPPTRRFLSHGYDLLDHYNSNIIANFKKLILALRLYNGNCIGIESLFIKKSFTYEGNDFNTWTEHPFLNVKFGNFSGLHNCQTKTIYLQSKEISSHDVKEINIIFANLMLYDLNPLEQIDKALEHYFNSFEHSYSVYIFSELIMSLETILNEHVKADSDEELNLIKKIRDADTEEKGRRILKKYQNKNSFHKTIKMLNQLLNPGQKNKNLNNFFYNDAKNGCYQIRNDLLHGNVNLDFPEIGRKIPDLEEYVRLTLLKIIDLRINNKLNCNEANYFERLNEILKI